MMLDNSWKTAFIRPSAQTLTEGCEGRKRQGMPSLTSALNVTVSSRAAAAASVAASGFAARALILSSTVCSSMH